MPAGPTSACPSRRPPVEDADKALGVKHEEDGVNTVELVGVEEVADPDRYRHQKHQKHPGMNCRG